MAIYRLEWRERAVNNSDDRFRGTGGSPVGRGWRTESLVLELTADEAASGADALAIARSTGDFVSSATLTAVE